MSIKVKDLRDQIGTKGPREVIYCPNCRIRYSANRGDYFNSPPKHVFTHCGRNMRLGIPYEGMRDWRPTHD